MRTTFFSSLQSVLDSINPIDKKHYLQAQNRLDSLTKPQGSLGRLEEIAAKLYSIQEGAMPLQASPAKMYTIAADHGVEIEGIAYVPQRITVDMSKNFLAGGAGINVLCNAAGADVVVVDVGVNGDFEPHPKLIQKKIAYGTNNIANGPAMTEEECLQAILIGVSLAEEATKDGIRVVGMGEMGIGNTTPSSAIFCALFGFTPEEMTGMGAGMPPKGLAHKTSIVQKALDANKEAVQSGNALKILASVGGLEIAALAGLVLGGAKEKLAVMVDGFIATAAYACAERLCPHVREYCFFSHGSAEAGHGKVMARIGEKPYLDLGLRLGEGSGAALGFYLLKAAATVINDMFTFEEAGFSAQDS